jgi:hypothetical protein
MTDKFFTLKKLVATTGAMPYQVKYLYSLGKLPVHRGSQGAGIPILYSPDSVDIVKKHIAKSSNAD